MCRTWTKCCQHLTEIKGTREQAAKYSNNFDNLIKLQLYPLEGIMHDVMALAHVSSISPAFTLGSSSEGAEGMLKVDQSN